MAQKEYRIKTLPAATAVDAIDWTSVPVADVDTYLWEEGYTPTTTSQMVYVEDHGFVLRMSCREANPLVTYHNYNDPVYMDSCMEFFADWLCDGRYINMEMNAAGTLLANVGNGRHGRTPIANLTDGAIFPVKGHITPDGWTVTAEIPLSLLARILGVPPLTVKSGFAFRGNFYKCGDKTAAVHFGMWNPVSTPKPDFHRPEYFGSLVVE